MTIERRLPFFDPPEELIPAAGRESPVVWVRRLQVLSELLPGEEHIIRDVTLRRGLNIVWAPAGTTGSGILGHTAGKTTFCRFLRYVLGEPNPADETTHRRLREKLRTAWVAAEVLVGGKEWTVARPLARAAKSFCVEGDLGQLFNADARCNYPVFIDSLGSTTVQRLAVRQLPAREGVELSWAHLLGWVARDQECRLAGILEWRHPRSDSGSPSLNKDEKWLLVRSVLGLVSPDEREEQATHARLLEQRIQAERDKERAEHQAEVDHQRIQESLGEELHPSDSTLFGTQARTDLESQKADLERRMVELAERDPRTELRERRDAALTVHAVAQNELDNLHGALQHRRDQVRSLEAQARGDAQAEAVRSLPPPSGYCSVPMDLAREHGCPLATTRPVSIDDARGRRGIAEDVAEILALIQDLETRIERQAADLDAAEVTRAQAHRAYMEAATAYEEERAELARELARLDYIEVTLAHAEASWKGFEKNSETVDQLQTKIRESSSRQEAQRRITAEAASRFSDSFRRVIQALLGDEVDARIECAGRRLNPVIDHHGVRQSAALDTVSAIAFDLAALTASIAGRGEFPRFLIHDGPREADLAQDIYHRMFQFARMLEKISDGEPAFQYIVTTTTPPPNDLQEIPWLRLRLAGTPAEERFLKENL